MRTFRKCMWCEQFTLEPDKNKVDKEMSQIRIQQSKKNLSLPEIKDLIRRYDIVQLEVDKALNPKCSFCGEDFNLEMMKDSEFIKHGLKLYDEYKIFIGDEGKNLPSKIEIRLNRERGGAMTDYDENLKLFFVEINPHNQINRCSLTSLFYHEFTHILQLTIDRDKCEKAKFYTEYHASAIEMMQMLRFKSINENRKLSLYDKVTEDNRTFIIKDYFRYETNKVLKRFRGEYEQLNASNIFSLLQQLMYHLGKMSVFKKQLDTTSLNVISEYTNEFEKYIASDLKCETDEKFHELFQNIVNFDNQIYNIIFNMSTDEDLNKYFEIGNSLTDKTKELWMHLTVLQNR